MPTSSMIFACTVTVLLLGASPAGATLNFPGAIQRILGAAQAPDCAVCHAGGQTGAGTVTTPLGMALKHRGLAPGDEAALQTALTRLEADKVDSNHNGVSDVDELRAGTDPNFDAAHPQVTYGCSVVASSVGTAWPLLLVALAWLLRGARPLRRRGRSRRCPR